jgi:demethylmenaquinone methyltransferase/2-methoxy-6-polyprenyl-1,4-benzoquinol methylase
VFSEIARTYDLLNTVFSVGMDRRWRRRAIAALDWRGRPDGAYVDLCAGTLAVGSELARERAFTGFIVGTDFAEAMLRAGRRRTSPSRLGAVVGDALRLPIADGVAAGAIVAFGVRNLSDLDAGLREAHRVLAPGARFVVLEFSTPRVPIVRSLYRLYFHRILPVIGGAVSGHPSAYRYLAESVDRFPEGDALAERMRAAGFTSVRWRHLSLGIAALHVGERAA